MASDEGGRLEHRRRGSPRQGERGSTPIIVALLVGAAILTGLAVWLLMNEPDATPAAMSAVERTSEAMPTPSVTAAPSRTGEVTVSSSAPGAVVSVDGERRGRAPQTVALEAGSHTVRVEKDGFHVFERQVQIIPDRTLELEARLEKVGPTLVVRADVPGAQVFLDRKFLGEAPVTVRDVERGHHRLNVSADGYEMHAEQIDVRDGTNEVEVSFKEVRLDESLAVKHKHGLGSCQGRLLATPEGLRYETDNEKDGFDFPLSSLEPLEVDYLDKTLRIEVRGERTYNFTSDDADGLLAFQKAVEDARERLQ